MDIYDQGQGLVCTLSHLWSSFPATVPSFGANPVFFRPRLSVLTGSCDRSVVNWQF